MSSRNKHHEILADNPELQWENPGEYELRQELARTGVENEPYPDRCDKCGSTHFEEFGGMVGETMLGCANCKTILWSDDEGAIRAVY